MRIKKSTRAVAVILTVLFVLTTLPLNAMGGTTESSGGLKKLQAVRVSDEYNRFPMFLITPSYKINVDRSNKGTGKLFNAAQSWGSGWQSGSGLLGFTYLSKGNQGDWAAALNGDRSFVTNKTVTTSITPGQQLWTKQPLTYETASIKSAGQFRSTGSAGSYNHIRLMAENSGATITGFNNGESGSVSIQTTKYPMANLAMNTSLKVGETVSISCSGTSYVPAANFNKGIKMELFVNSGVVKTESKSNNTASFKFPYKFTSEGTFVVLLRVTDGVGRVTDAAKFVNVVSAGGKPPSGGGGTYPPPPPPPSYPELPQPDPPDPPEPEPPVPDNREPVARVSYPIELPRDYEYNIVDSSYDRDGSIIDWDWKIPSGCEVISGFDSNGGNGRVKFAELGEYKFKLTVTDDGIDSQGLQGDPLSNSVEFTIEVINMEPEARFTWMEGPMQGEDVEIKDYSHDKDGEIAERKWEFIPSEGVAVEVEPLGETGGKVYFDKPGEVTLKLTVKDNDGMTDTYEQKTEVKPAIPVAFIHDDPYSKKQNRLVTFYGEYVHPVTGELEESLSSTSSERYPIVWDQAQWNIVPMDDSIDASSIKIKEDGDLTNRQVVFKEPGKYKATLKVINTAGHWSEPYEIEFEVAKDEPPVADFFLISAFLRELDEDNPDELAKATITLVDASYSIDGDDIAQRIWKYKYDSDNDGSFDDEIWTVLNNGNETEPSLTVTDVGNYRFELEVVEGFGEPTIVGFISDEDYLRANTDNKLMIEKITEVINIAPVVSWEQIVRPKVDVVFTLGDSPDAKKTSLSNTTAYFQSILESAGLNTSILDMNTSTISSKDQNIDTIINSWKTVGGDVWTAKNGNLTCNLPGGTGGGSWRGTIIYNHLTMGLDDVDIKFKSNNGANLMEGVGWRITRNTDGTFNGYFLNVGTHWMQGVSLMKFNKVNFDAPFDHSHLGRMIWCGHTGPSHNGRTVTDGSASITHLATYPNVLIGDVSVSVKGDRHTVIFNGNKIMEVNDSTYNEGTYGFWGNNCEVTSAMLISDINITIGDSKTLDQVVTEHTWRTGAMKFVADLHDTTYQPEYLDKPPRIAVLFGELLSGEIDLSVLGTSTNKPTGERMIQLNDSEGIFILNQNNMTTPLNTYAQYVINKVKAKEDKEDYLIVNEDEIIITPSYSDTENDPWISERWKYLHEPEHFENNMGIATYHDTYIPNPVTVFDKTGEFNITMQRRDDPKADFRFDNYRQWSVPIIDDPYTLYVHRKPVPQFSFTIQETGGSIKNVTITENSFDLDSESLPDRGIVSKEWYWKEANALTWTSGKPTQIEQTKSYLVKLIVEDYQGKRVQDVKAIINEGMPPVAKFIVDPNPAIAKKPFNITDLSYDPNGDAITERQWRVKNTTGTWQNRGSSKPTVFNELGLYVIELKVKDSKGMWSEPYSQDVLVNNLAPVAQFTMASNPATPDAIITFTDTSYDPNGDAIVERVWSVTNPAGDSTVDYATPPNNYPQVGDWVITLKVKDEHGLWSVPASRILQIENRPPNAQFTMIPNPAKVNGDVRFTNLSWDPDGHSMSFYWEIELNGGLVETINDGYRTTPYEFTKSFGTEGKYFITLYATDQVGGVGEITHTLTVWTPLEITNSVLQPNPAQAGIRITATVETDGYAEGVRLTYNDEKIGTQTVDLVPSGSTANKTNTWTGKFRTSPWIQNGAYPVIIEARRGGVSGISGPQTDNITEYLHIEGTVYDDTLTSITN